MLLTKLAFFLAVGGLVAEAFNEALLQGSVAETVAELSGGSYGGA